MGIQSFAGSSSSLPGQTFIDQVYLTYKVRKWARAGSPGFYRATSALGKDGYVYFVQSDNSIVQAPLNGIANVTLPFTEIRILATQFDMISLFKVSAKGTDTLTLTPNYTTITSSGLYTFPSNAVGFCDALIVGAGGGSGHHTAGAGAGGIYELTSIPLTVGGTFSVTVGTSAGASQGGSTSFQGHTVTGGGHAHPDSEGAGYSGAAGGGGRIVAAASSQGAGSGDASLSQLNSDKAASTWLATLGTSLTVPLLQQAAVIKFSGGAHNGGSVSSIGHTGGGGGGATGNGGNCTGNTVTPPAGGTGLLYNFGDGERHYSVGGAASRHNNQSNGPNQTGWSATGYGMGARSDWSSPSRQAGGPGVIIVRTWGL